MVLADASPWLAVFGRCHPVLLHAPLGLIPALLLFEFGPALLRRPVPRGSVLTLAILSALSAAAAAASGFVLGGENGGGELQGQHKVLGLVFAGLCLVLPFVALLQRRVPFRVLLLAAAGVMLPVGHLGGTLTHGQDFLFAPLRAKPTPPVAPTVAAGPPTYARVAPVLERVCVACHNPEKQKAELLLHTRAGIDQGGENGAVVVAGKPEASPLLLRCELPLEHDDHMPPEGKAQPTAAEVALLRAWIAAGCQ
jgi:uncharacterized membrane protein